MTCSKQTNWFARFLLSLGLLGLWLVPSCRSPIHSDLKIIGGTPVSVDDPLAARVAVLMDQEEAVVCTVAPIARDVFLTAAHCVFGKDLSGWTIRTGLSIAAESESETVRKNPKIVTRV